MGRMPDDDETRKPEPVSVSLEEALARMRAVYPELVRAQEAGKDTTKATLTFTDGVAERDEPTPGPSNEGD
jgi:hypothetical protein